MDKNNVIDYGFKPNFCDEVITALRNPKKNVPGLITHKKKLEFYKRKITRNIVDSQKFILDREMIKHAVKTSFCKPSDLKKLTTKAIPPFNSMWIEWDERYRSQQILNYYNDPTTNRNEIDLGYLIQRADETADHYNNVYTIQLFYRDRSDPITRKKILIPPFSATWGIDNNFMFNRRKKRIQGDGSSFIMSDSEWKYTTVSYLLSHKYLSAYFEDFSEVNRFTVGQSELGSYHKGQNFKKLRNPQLFENKTKNFLNFFNNKFIMGETYSGGFHKDWFTDSNNIKIANNSSELGPVHLLPTLKTMYGDVRFLISVLSILNVPPLVTKRHVDPKRRSGSIGQPRNSYTLVYIDLPKKINLVNATIKGTGAPKRFHHRRGHWRIVNQGTPQQKWVWIEPMEVGNKKFGVIEHDYVLRGKKSKNVT